MTGSEAVTMVAALSFFGFLGHLVGDYVIQTGWMAQNKAKPLFDLTCISPPAIDDSGFRAITTHALSWTLAVEAFLLPAAWIALGEAGAHAAIIAAFVLGAIHWIQDRRWPVVWLMRKLGKDHSQMWLLIVFDNTLHLLQILGAAVWIVWTCA